MSEGFASAIVGGAETLIRSAIRSVNYVANTSGWRIAKNGFAEFANVLVNGTGTITVQAADGSYVRLIIQPGVGAKFETQPPNFAGTIYLPGGIFSQQNGAARRPQLELISPSITGAGAPADILLQAEDTANGLLTRIALEASEVNIPIGGDLTLPGSFHETTAVNGPFVGTGFQDVIGLDSIPVKAGALYVYELHVSYTGTAGGGAKFAWNPVGGTITVARNMIGEPTSSSTPSDTNVFLNRKTAPTSQPVGGGTGDYHEWGRIENTGLVDGTITFRAGENVASTGMTIFANSWFRCERIR